MEMTMNRYSVIAGAAIVVALMSPALGNAQSPLSDQWLAWQGCWHAEGDEASNILCVVPEGLGVRMVTLAGVGVVQSESRIVADGVPRRVNQEGCQGSERASWSSDKARLFLHSDQTCGAGISRKVSGIISMISPTRWTTVQAVVSGSSEPAVRVMQYTAVDPVTVPIAIRQAITGNRLSRETARIAASTRLDLSDVREAVGIVDPLVVENWLTVTKQVFNLDAKKLVTLADAGVPGGVIDALVAVSNPEHFEIQGITVTPNEDEKERRDRRAYDCDPYSWFDYGYRSCNYYGRGGYYGYSPYAYDYYLWGYNNRPIIIVRGEDNGNGEEPIRARATKNGYTSGRSSNTGSSSSSGRSSSGSSTSSTSSGSSSSGSSSSSSSGSSTTRTAKPRGSGGS